MGGPAPIWELHVDAGDLRLQEDPWKGVVRGMGVGRIRWRFPNGNAVSKWLEIELTDVAAQESDDDRVMEFVLDELVDIRSVDAQDLEERPW